MEIDSTINLRIYRSSLARQLLFSLGAIILLMKLEQFKNNPTFHQINCRESRDGSIDLRQANGVNKYKPDIILLEYPVIGEYPDFPFNKYAARDKPKELVDKRTRDFPPEVLKTDPWVVADTYMWREIAKQWSGGNQIYVYPTDGPHELISEWREVWEHMYPQATHNWVWWVQIYLREKLMASHIKWVLDKHKDINKPVVNVYLQSFHWKHVKFLLSNPSPDEIWGYYFGRFANDITRDTITFHIKKLNLVFYKYWQRYSDFKDLS